MTYCYIDETQRAGWDFLYEDCFAEINQIIGENLDGKEHNQEAVEKLCDILYGLKPIASY